MHFRAGDTVRLKSGGPVMTVEDDDGLPTIGFAPPTTKCVWFAGNTLKRGAFQDDILQPASPKLALVKGAKRR